MDIVDIDYHSDGSYTVHYSDGSSKTTKSDGTVKEDSSGGDGSIWKSIIGAIPGILLTLFPNGASGNSSNHYPTVTPIPGGTQVGLSTGGTNTILLIALVCMAAYMIFSNKQPVKARR